MDDVPMGLTPDEDAAWERDMRGAEPTLAELREAVAWKRSKYLSAWAYQFTTGRSPSNLEASAKMYVDTLEQQLGAVRAERDALREIVRSLSDDAYRDYVTQASGVAVTTYSRTDWERERGIYNALRETGGK